MTALADLLRSPVTIPAAATAGVALLTAALLVHRARRRQSAANAPRTAPVPESPVEGTPAAEVLRMFGALRPGDSIEGFRIAAVYEEDLGCVPVVFEGPGGARFRVDVLRRREGDPIPPAATEKLALYLAGRPQGSATPEECGRVMAALAAVLSETASDPPRWLITIGERSALLGKFPG